jgi:hypothetical protein
MTSNRWRLEGQSAKNCLRSRLDAIQRLTQGVRVAVVELNVVGGVHARPDTDRGADDERHGLGFGFAHGLGRRSVVTALVKQLVRLCTSEHKRTYVRAMIMCACNW